MIAPGPSRRLAGGGQRKGHSKGCALSPPATGGADCSAVQLHQMAHDRQPQTETAVRPRRASLELAETVEDKGEKLRLDPLAGVAHSDRNMRSLAFEADRDLPSCGRELDGIGHEVPDDLLQTVGVSCHRPRSRTERRD